MELLPKNLPADPLPLTKLWLDEAMQERAQPNPNSMSLATVNELGQPSVRIVLCKDLIVDPGFLVLYTNYLSAKAADIEKNSNVAFVMHWDSKGRQVRGEGLLIKSPAKESDAYFMSRNRDSRVGAWASLQSQRIASREALEQQFAETNARFADREVPRPAHWGGYRLWFTAIELWLNLESRLHDRARWERSIQLPEQTGQSPITLEQWRCCGRLQP
jgi:pyridoxamine 5'-phosphate oxidase